MKFDGFTATDFDAYLPRKWSSNVFNRERLQVKEKLAALGRELGPQLLAGDGSLLACEVSVEHPALWNQHRVEAQYLFFSRNQDARRKLDGIISQKRSMASLIEDPSPLRNHIFLAVRLDAQGIELGVWLHADAAVDRENLQRKTHDFFAREKLLLLLRQLPAEVLVSAGASVQPACELDDDALQRALREPGSWFSVTRRFGREDAVLSGGSFLPVVQELLVRLLPIHHYAAWASDNDFLSMRETLRDKQVQQKARHLGKNDKVRVIRGVFSGKIGVVQEVDGKGALRVQLGTLVVKLAAEDVVAG